MTIPQLMPWIGGPVKFEAGLSPLVCPIDESVASHMIESDAKVVDAAVKHAHAAFLKHQDATTAKRVGTFMRACAAQLPHLMGEVLPLDVTATGAGRFGFTTRVPYGVVAAIT